MLRLKIISFFLCLLLLLQMLPLAQIGNSLSQNQWTEELPHAPDEAAKGDASVNFNHPFLPPADYLSHISIFSATKADIYIHHSEQIPSNHSTEVVSPPPDAA